MQASPFLFALGRPFSPLYSVAMRLRESGYRRGFFSSYRLPVPVVSIGNLTMGGTGKTPMVQYVARLLQRQGWRPAVISRGYGGRANDKINVVSDGQKLLLDARAAGDEPRLLAETLPGIPVLTGLVRRLPAQEAVTMGADVLVLDDGFQHLAIRRDVNLVLFNTDRLAGNSRVFPGGDLREPVAALHRATGFVLTGVRPDNQERARRFSKLLQAKFPELPVTQTGYQATTLVQVGQDCLLGPPVSMPDTAAPCLAFCGIAHPASFRQTIFGQGYTVTEFVALEDHQRYSDVVLERLLTKARQAKAAWLLTTEKDLVKLSALAANCPLPLYALRMEVVADPFFEQALLTTFGR